MHVLSRIYITESDMERLRRLIEGLRNAATGSPNVEALEEELDRAEVVAPDQIPADVVTMGSEVRLKDLDTGKVMVYRVVYPNSRSEGSSDNVSVLAPLGTALLGYRAGDIIEWPVPRGIRRLKVLKVLFQPEAQETSAA
jgi:regulator of nucleoside diphosphate kinase